MPGVGIAVGVRREVTRDVFHELAPFGPKCGGKQNGRQVGTAAAERDDSVAVAAGEKARGDDYVKRREQLVQAERADERPAARAFRVIFEEPGEKPGLMHVDAGRAHTARLKRQGQERDGSELARRPE